MFNPSEKDEKAWLEVIKDKLEDALSDIDTNVAQYSEDLSRQKSYLYENKTGMDAAEKASVKQSINMQAITGEAAVALKNRLRKLQRSPYFGRIDFSGGGSAEADFALVNDGNGDFGKDGKTGSGDVAGTKNESNGDASKGGKNDAGAVAGKMGKADKGALTGKATGEKAPSAEAIYIGIHSFFDEDENVNLIHDWRAPISGMFYDFELGQAYYESPSGRKEGEIVRKRQYRIRDGNMEMMLESEMQIRDDILQKELSRAADDKMKNIVATIQRDQNAIIRNETSPVLVIQGVAGSGKTSIALHRIAFLLYRFKETITARDILIISPNKVFADYISNVLPELGEDTIPEMGIETLAGIALEGKFKYESFFDQVTRLLEKPDPDFIERMQFKASYEFLGKLNSYMAWLSRENFDAANIPVRLKKVPASYVRNCFLSYERLPMFRRLTEMTRDIYIMVERELRYDLKASEKNKIRSEVKKMFKSTSVRALYKQFYEWVGRPELFTYAKGTTYEYADVFPLIYLKMKLEGVESFGKVRHLLVDEMQDYTPVQYAVLSRMFTCNKTILGDANQSVNPYSSTTSSEIQQVLNNADLVTLNKSYRSTYEIAQFAQRISPNSDLEAVERFGEEPQIHTFAKSKAEVDYIIQDVARFKKTGQHTLGIICKTQKQTDKMHKMLQDAGVDGINKLNAGSSAFSSGIILTTAHLAKGLEFDEVLVPGVTGTNYATEIDKSMLYIACTRAMHRLTLTSVGEASRFLG